LFEFNFFKVLTLLNIYKYKYSNNLLYIKQHIYILETILATGGLGFIGSHTCIELLRKNYNLIIIDSLINNSTKSVSQLKLLLSKEYKISNCSLIFKKGDIRDESFLNEVFTEAKNRNKPIDAVIHFAGLKSVNESIKNPFDYWNVNVGGSLNLLKVMRENNCRTIIFSSSATIYKPKMNVLINEESELEPINPYGQTKLAIEKILNDMSKEEFNDWRIINLRYFNPVGAHHSGLIGENPKVMPTNLFPVLMRKLRLNEMVPIFGKSWPTKDGTCVRDYIHVVDLATAHSAALELVLKNKSIFLNLNIGNGKGISVLEVIKTFSKIINFEIPYYFSKERDGDAPFVVAENSLALEKLNWQPIKNLDDMCRDALNWHQKNNSFN